MPAGRMREFGGLILVVLLGLAGVVASLEAQPPGSFNEREVKSYANTQDTGDIWVLDFTFKDPRLITVDIPGRGRKLVWYLWYQVINRTGQPRIFIPDFELVTEDKPHTFPDEVLPKVQKAIQNIEDPTHAIDLKNSVTISSEPIPVSAPGTLPHKVTGVAIWDDTTPPKEQILQESTHFSIFVGGLSNGWSVVDGKEGEDPIVRRKTLQLKFHRLGDRYFQDARDIRFVPPAEWLYRASTLAPPNAEPKLKKGEGTPKPKLPEPPQPKEEGPPLPKEEGAKPGNALSLVPKEGEFDMKDKTPPPIRVPER